MQPVILIGDINLAKDILDKHSTKHSSRPVVPYVRYHVDPDKVYWGTFEEGETHAIGRKLTTGIMSAVRAGKTEQLQEFEALLNIQKLLDDGGKEWFHHIKRIINVFPFLDFIPGPMPWRTRAQSFRERDKAIFKKLIDEAVTGKASGMNTWAAAFAREDKPEGDQSRLMNMFTLAAIETTTASLHTFILACICHPEWVAIVQNEIDAVVGLDRLPSLKDRPFLPYVEAVVRARFGLPHYSTANDLITYNGQEYFIPKGSVIFAVSWAIEHDQSRFEDHDRFMPERFLDVEGKLKSNYNTSAFGFGRRICPGIPFAEQSLWIEIATMLWTFNIRKSGEPDPKTGLPFHYDDSDVAFSGDLTNSPLKFPAVFEPRSSRHVEVARREWAECEKDLKVLLPAPKSE
ncbi:hypothetical protein C0991_001022 [Blastosporella zonata]|nr:hypothetical protein C0991_001022 [Blastosporella zonata]